MPRMDVSFFSAATAESPVASISSRPSVDLRAGADQVLALWPGVAPLGQRMTPSRHSWAGLGCGDHVTDLFAAELDDLASQGAANFSSPAARLSPSTVRQTGRDRWTRIPRRLGSMRGKSPVLRHRVSNAVTSLLRPSMRSAELCSARPSPAHFLNAMRFGPCAFALE